MTPEDFVRDYFDWLYDQVCYDDLTEIRRLPTYHELLWRLYQTEFYWMSYCPLDENRAKDGVYLRRTYIAENAYPQDLFNAEPFSTMPCSVLEMMIGLAVRCEENIMCNDSKGDRTGQWFWNMLTSLGLEKLNDERWYELASPEKTVDKKLQIFLDRQYKPNGKGGLFTVKNPRTDLSKIEIWRQMHMYLGQLPEVKLNL